MICNLEMAVRFDHGAQIELKFLLNNSSIYELWILWKRTYIPDFYLIDTNTIIEIKSEFTIDYQNIKDKKKACIEQGYNFILYLEHKIKEI